MSDSKIAVFDPRLVQKNIVRRIQKGGADLSITDYEAESVSIGNISITANTTRDSWIDRPVTLENTIYCKVDLAFATAPAANEVIMAPGIHFNVLSHPTQKLSNSVDATVNGESFTQQTDLIQGTEVIDTITESDNNKKAGCNPHPVNFDKFAYNKKSQIQSGYSTLTGASYNSQSNPSNGTYVNVEFCDKNGAVLPKGSLTSVDWKYDIADDTKVLRQVRGIPHGDGTVTDFTLYLKITSSEVLRLSPFQFLRKGHFGTAFYGVDMIKLRFNMGTDFSRIIKRTPGLTAAGLIPDSFSISSWSPYGKPFENVRLRIQSLTTPTGMVIPPINRIPYCDMQVRTNTTSVVNMAEGSVSPKINSQPISLGVIPHGIVCWFDLPSYASEAKGKLLGTDNHFFLPFETIEIQFNSQSTKLTNHSTLELYKMNYENGIHVDYPTFIGQGVSGFDQKTFLAAGGDFYSHMRGSPLFLKFAKDITLPSNLAPGVHGSFNLTVRATFRRPLGSKFLADYTTERLITSVRLNVMTVDFGICETSNGKTQKMPLGVDMKDSLMAKSYSSFQKFQPGGTPEMVGGSLFGHVFDFGKKIANKALDKVVGKVVDKGFDRLTGNGRPVMAAGKKSSKIDLSQLY